MLCSVNEVCDYNLIVKDIYK
jgi:K+-sensing histidine kinase KdpD